MDWMSASTDTGIVASAPPGIVAALPQGQAAPTPVGSFDAIRVYLWAGLADPQTPHVREELASLHGMASYLSQHVAPPRQVGPEGQILNADGPAGFSAAVIPYLDSLGQTSAKKAEVDRLGALLDEKSGLYGKDGPYYDQNLVLFEDGWSTGRFRFDKGGELHAKWK
jgi:endo-1,4-beta-D-glucanase Y